MINQDYDYLKKRWLEFWNQENHDRPILTVTAPRDKANWSRMPAFIEDNRTRWMDIDYMLKKNRAVFENTYFGAEAFPIINPDLGPDLIGAACGCDIHFGEDTTWVVHLDRELSELSEIIHFDPDNRWVKHMEEMTRAAVEDARGDYLVGITDLHPGADALVSLRGSQNLCLDVYDCPEYISPLCSQIFEVYREIYNRLDAIISPHQQGTANWMGIWHPEKRWYVVGCDFSCLVSCENYEQCIEGAVKRELDFLEASMYHLDGPGALRHMDRILQFEKLGGVQWVYGEGQPTARYWLDVLRKIQAAGKNIQILCVPEDIKDVCEALEPEGVNIVCHARDEAEAKSVIAAVEDIYTAKRGACRAG